MTDKAQGVLRRLIDDVGDAWADQYYGAPDDGFIETFHDRSGWHCLACGALIYLPGDGKDKPYPHHQGCSYIAALKLLGDISDG